MKKAKADEIIARSCTKRFYISFERLVSGGLESDYIPEPNDDRDEPFSNVDEAWDYAIELARSCDECLNVYVVDGKLKPVSEYASRILNRYP